MKNYLSEGVVIDVIAPAGGAKSGEFAMHGDMFGCYVTSAKEGEKVGLQRSGKFEASSAETFAAHVKIYWKADTKTFVKTASGNTKVGLAVTDCAGGSFELVLVPSL